MLQTQTIELPPPQQRRKAEIDYTINVAHTLPKWLAREIERLAAESNTTKSHIVKTTLINGLGLKRPVDQ